ncbi:flavohemoprotein [Streptomyces mobaraensis]|uniref:nitric oxide dioxygenase n=2 Tax=Streptomyces mobaraensis TaxID=35621 RepID=A0A5N5WD19_STRMB|nr:flavohemoprotein [Streptomyces mobaraensis]
MHGTGRTAVRGTGHTGVPGSGHANLSGVGRTDVPGAWSGTSTGRFRDDVGFGAEIGTGYGTGHRAAVDDGPQRPGGHPQPHTDVAGTAPLPAADPTRTPVGGPRAPGPVARAGAAAGGVGQRGGGTLHLARPPAVTESGGPPNAPAPFGHGRSAEEPHGGAQSRTPAATPVPPIAAAAPPTPTATPATAAAAPSAATVPPPTPSATATPATATVPPPEATGAAAPAAGSADGAADDATPDSALIRRTLAEIEPIADTVVSHFYALLFLHHPPLRDLFPPAMDAQRDRLFKALLTAARHADDPAALTAYLCPLGRGHRKYGTRPEHYPAVGESLIGALARYATRTWSPAAEAAWVRVYTVVSQTMIDAAAEDEPGSPPWWHAEIVGHELRTPDIAVLTLRPDQPYPFLAGQYTSVETPWWPRVWRHYSFSSAPRPDGLLSLHVKAVPAGWVSGALVHRARPGDVLRLGPPAGSMIVDHTTDNGLLCLGGGTGIAPIKALVEDVAEHGGRRPVEVFYGARHAGDLYDMDTMRDLERTHPWLSVRPVVSDGPTSALSGQLPHVVRAYGPWNAYDAYLSGPPGMIRSGLDTLVGAGIPTHRIRHDGNDGLLAEARG